MLKNPATNRQPISIGSRTAAGFWSKRFSTSQPSIFAASRWMRQPMPRHRSRERPDGKYRSTANSGGWIKSHEWTRMNESGFKSHEWTRMNTNRDYDHFMNRREFLFSAAAVTALGQKAPNLAFVSALAAADAIRKRTISSVELTKMCFERIDRYNPKLNAIIFRMEQQALKRAAEADAALARRESTGPFHGV